MSKRGHTITLAYGLATSRLRVLRGRLNQASDAGTLAKLLEFAEFAMLWTEYDEIGGVRLEPGRLVVERADGSEFVATVWRVK